MRMGVRALLRRARSPSAYAGSACAEVDVSAPLPNSRPEPAIGRRTLRMAGSRRARTFSAPLMRVDSHLQAAPPAIQPPLSSARTPSMDRPVPVTDLQELAPTVRALVNATLQRFVPDEPTTQRFHREWSGGWRVRVEIGRPPRGRLDFVLFHTPEGSIVALPHPMPPAWRSADGFPAADGSLWTITEDGAVARC